MFDDYKYINKIQETALHDIKKMDIQSRVYVHLYWQNLLNIHSKVVCVYNKLHIFSFYLKQVCGFAKILIFHSYLHSFFIQVPLER